MAQDRRIVTFLIIAP